MSFKRFLTRKDNVRVDKKKKKVNFKAVFAKKEKKKSKTKCFHELKGNGQIGYYFNPVFCLNNPYNSQKVSLVVPSPPFL